MVLLYLAFSLEYDCLTFEDGGDPLPGSLLDLFSLISQTRTGRSLVKYVLHMQLAVCGVVLVHLHYSGCI